MQSNHYGSIETLGTGLHVVRGEFGRSPLGRRMTVVELPGGGLALHSPIRMADTDMASLEALGRVRLILVPNTFHKADAHWFAERYPAARVLVPDQAQAKLAKGFRVDGGLVGDWERGLDGILEPIALGGLRTHETAFFHGPSRSLILTDIVFNLSSEFKGITRLLLKLNGSLGVFGPSWISRQLSTRSKSDLAASIQVLQQLDYDRVIMSHGDILESGGKEAMAEAFAYLEH